MSCKVSDIIVKYRNGCTVAFLQSVHQSDHLLNCFYAIRLSITEGSEERNSQLASVIRSHPDVRYTFLFVCDVDV